MSLKRKVMGGLFYTASARFLAQIVTWAITIVIIRLLSPGDYGLMELASVFVAFLAMLNELGLGAAIVQRKEIDDNLLRSLFGFVLIASVAFYLLLAAAAPAIGDFYGEPRLVALIQVFALQFILMGFTVLPQSLMLRDMAFRKIAVIDFISAVMGSLGTLVFALLGYGVWALVWWSLIIRIVVMVGSNVAHPFLRLPRFTLAGMEAIFSFGGYVTLSRVVWYCYSRADILIIGKILGKELLGLYAVGIYLASLPMEKISGVINQVAFPAFAQIQEEPGLAGQHFLKAVRVMSFFAFPVLWGISSIATEIIGVFLGAKWQYAAVPMQVVALVIPLRMISNLMNPAVLGSGRPDVSFYNSFVALLLMPVSFLIGSQWGLVGVSLAWVFAFPLVFLINLSRVVKVLAIRSRDVFAAMLTPLLSGLVMYVGVQSVKYSYASHYANGYRMTLMIALGAALYSLTTFLINRRGLNEVIALTKT